MTRSLAVALALFFSCGCDSDSSAVSTASGLKTDARSATDDAVADPTRDAMPTAPSSFGPLDGGADGSICNDVVPTPGGIFARVCVHEVPSGASVSPTDAGGIVVRYGGQVIATYPPCPCKPPGSTIQH